MRNAALIVMGLLLSACAKEPPAAHAPAETESAEAGETSRVVLSAEAERTAEIAVTALAAATASDAGAALIVPGTIEADPRRLAVVSARAAGRVERMLVVEGDRVRAGETIAYLYSPAYATAQSDVRQAARRVIALRGTDDESGASALLDAARRRLQQLGVAAAEIDRVAGGAEPRDLLALTAPIDGSVAHADVAAGAAVEAGAAICQIADLSIVDVVASVPERAVASVRIGQPATVTVAAYPAARFTGHVERLRDVLDSATRTVGAVVHVGNPTRTLRLGMYATVALDVPRTTTVAANARVDAALLEAPEGAVVTDGAQSYVFVRVAPRTYERRAVTVTPLAPTGHDAEARVALSGDVRSGDRVVVRGAFTLKSELAKAAFGDDD